MGKKNRHQLVKAGGGSNKNPASSYSPTQLPMQYHRRMKGLTSVFGMGTGVALSLTKPENPIFRINN